ncbi:MAG: hypothetical protein V3T39_00285 [Gammaproteobacteria bacterium]
MSNYYIRLTFYGRDRFVDFPCTRDEYRNFFDAAKKLATGGQNVASHFLLSVTADVKALIAIKEVQAVYFMEGEKVQANNVQNITPILDTQGISLYLKGRQQAIDIQMSGQGPLDDMIAGLTDSDYAEDGNQCVMLADDEGCSIFFVLDEIQYALVSASLVNPSS